MKRSLCVPCRLQLALVGHMHWRGRQLLHHSLPSPGGPGVVYFSASELPPPSAKWVFPTSVDVKSKVGSTWLPVGPEYLQKLPRCDKPQRYALAGMAVQGFHVFVSAKGPRNAFKALLGRGFAPPTFRPEPGLFAKMRPLLRDLIAGFTERVSYLPDDWIAHLPGSKKRQARLAQKNIQYQTWDDRWGEFAAFVKLEKLDGTCESRFVTTVLDRLIQAPTPEALVIAAPYTWQLTHRLKTLWHEHSPIFYASTSPDVISRWFQRVYRPGKIAVCADYRKFDNSHSLDSWDFVESFYKEAIVDDVFFRLLELWRKPRGKMTGRGWAFKYVADYMNASGRSDTALANALLNGLVMFISLCALYFDVDLLELNRSHITEFSSVVDLAVVGDDSLALVPDLPCFWDAKRLSLTIARFGFDASDEKLIITADPFDMVFLGMRPYPVDGIWWFSKTIGRYIYKAGHVLHPTKYDVGAWVAGCAEADEHILRCVPALHEYCQSVARLRSLNGKHSKTTRQLVDEHRPWASPSDTPPYKADTIRYLARGYDVPVSMVMDSIVAMRTIPILPYVTDDPFLVRCCTVDAR